MRYSFRPHYRAAVSVFIENAPENVEDYQEEGRYIPVWRGQNNNAKFVIAEELSVEFLELYVQFRPYCNNNEIAEKRLKVQEFPHFAWCIWVHSNICSFPLYECPTRTWSLLLEKLFDKQTDMSSKEPGICTCFLSWSIRILENNPMQWRATITSKKNGRFIFFPFFLQTNVGPTHWSKAGLWKGLQSLRALTDGVCRNTAHVQVVTVAYCSIFLYPHFSYSSVLFPPKNACCSLTTLFFFETNIYLRVCLTFVTFFILITKVSNSQNCWPNAIHLRRAGAVSWVGINGGESF